MNALNEEQTASVSGWVRDGAGLSEVQKRIQSEFGISLTYLETRLLVDDLKLAIQDPEPDEPPPLPDDAPDALGAEPPPLPAGDGKVRVSIDQITKPQALVSGKITFSDGQTGEWMLDQLGRLALNPDTPGYRPSESDIMAFQVELQSLARKQGF